MFHCSTALKGKNFSVTYVQNFSCCYLCVLFLLLPLCILRVWLHLLYKFPICRGRQQVDAPLAFSSEQTQLPQPSPCTLCAPTFQFRAFLLGVLQFVNMPLAPQPSPRCNLPDVASPLRWMGIKISLPLLAALLLMQPRLQGSVIA